MEKRGAKRQRIRHVIFDLDGTLADTAVLTMEAFRRIAPRNGLPVPDLKQVRRAMGYANPEFYEHLFPEYPLKQVHRAGVQVEAEELRLLPRLETDLLFPGVREMLRELALRGVGLYIASTGGKEHVDAIVDHAGIGEFFAEIRCGQPDKAEMIGKLISGRPRERFLMVGDMRKDCEGAHANGIVAVGACFGYCVRGQESFDRYLENTEELLGILQQ